jgi:hypothetical protein
VWFLDDIWTARQLWMRRRMVPACIPRCIVSVHFQSQCYYLSLSGRLTQRSPGLGLGRHRHRKRSRSKREGCRWEPVLSGGSCFSSYINPCFVSGPGRTRWTSKFTGFLNRKFWRTGIHALLCSLRTGKDRPFHPGDRASNFPGSTLPVYKWKAGQKGTRVIR